MKVGPGFVLLGEEEGREVWERGEEEEEGREV